MEMHICRSKLSNSRYYTSVLLCYISLSAFVLFLSFHVVMGDHPATSPAGNYRNVYLITTECWYPHYALQTAEDWTLDMCVFVFNT